MGLEFHLDELVAELASRGTCRGELVKYLKKIYLKYLVELPFNLNFKLKFPYSTRDECNHVYNKKGNNFILTNQ